MGDLVLELFTADEADDSIPTQRFTLDLAKPKGYEVWYLKPLAKVRSEVINIVAHNLPGG